MPARGPLRFAKAPLPLAAGAVALLAILDLLWFGAWFPAGLPVAGPEDLAPPPLPLLVLGAGVRPNGDPTPVLEGRLRMAARLFGENKAAWILVSGDNRTPRYNEPQAMRRWLARHGVPAEKIVSDYAGRRTYDSLKRAKMIFGVKGLVVVTSGFHMPRALFLARSMGLDAVGVPSETKSVPWADLARLRLREHLARHRAQVDVWFPPGTRLGPTEDTPDSGLRPK
jgi:vancomycin permeability regulator SanA